MMENLTSNQQNLYSVWIMDTQDNCLGIALLPKQDPILAWIQYQKTTGEKPKKGFYLSHWNSLMGNIAFIPFSEPLFIKL